MRAGDSAEAINEQAAAWLVRISHSNDDPAIAKALAEWLTGDRRRRGAYLRAQATWARLGDAIANPQEDSTIRSVIGRRMLLAGGASAVAASIAALCVQWPFGRSYSTAIGEQSTNLLTDGSVMLLNTDSLGTVAMTPARREVDLVRGEARFDVAKDKNRPFVVSAGAIRVEAVGTVFAVRKRAWGADVVITSGRVRIWSIHTPTRFLTLDAGHRVSVSEAEGADKAAVQADGIDRAMAWNKGMIALDGMTLAEAAAEFNRYNRRQVTVEEGLADQKIIGWFNAHDADGFARSAAAMVGGKVEQDANTIRIVH